MQDKAILEAILFSSPEPIGSKELMELTGFTAARLKDCLESLSQDYEERGSALQVMKVAGKHSLLLREEYRDQAWKLSPKQIPDAALRTASLIAYHQPVVQSELVRTLGSRVYEDVRLLRSLNLLTVKKVGQTLELSTNNRFAEYFGIEAKGKKGVKKWMEGRLEVLE